MTESAPAPHRNRISPDEWATAVRFVMVTPETLTPSELGTLLKHAQEVYLFGFLDTDNFSRAQAAQEREDWFAASRRGLAVEEYVPWYLEKSTLQSKADPNYPFNKAPDATIAVYLSVIRRQVADSVAIARLSYASPVEITLSSPVEITLYRTAGGILGLSYLTAARLINLGQKWNQFRVGRTEARIAESRGDSSKAQNEYSNAALEVAKGELHERFADGQLPANCLQRVNDLVILGSVLGLPQLR